MENFKFLKKEDAEETAYYSIYEDRIETLKVTETYNNNGQLVSAYDAGNSLTLDSKKAVNIANSAYEEENEEQGTFKIGDLVMAFEQQQIYDAVVASSCVEDVDYTDYAETCQGFNYFDGSNWKTIILKYENWGDYLPYKLITDEKLVAKLNEAINTMEYVSESHGIESHETEEFVIEKRHFASAFENYKISEK